MFGIYISASTSQPTGDYKGLFGFAEGGSIKNTGVAKSFIRGRNNIGGITNCCNAGTIIGGNNNIGGVAGESYYNIINCYNTGAVTGTSNLGNNIGGVVGYATGNITDCYNSGTVTGSGYGGSNGKTGGVAGSSAGGMSNCYNEGRVDGLNYTGGITGRTQGDVINCYNTGAVSGREVVGGIAGGLSGNINDIKVANCFNAGTVTASNLYTGGIAGSVEDKSIIINCYNSGAVTSNWAGGVAGMMNLGSITKVYFLISGDINSGLDAVYFQLSGTVTDVSSFNEDGYDSLLSDLNKWVAENNADGEYMHWKSDILYPAVFCDGKFISQIISADTLRSAATCTESATYWYSCDCGIDFSDEFYFEDGNPLGHTPSDWIIDKAATAAAAGSKHKECTICGEVLETEVIPATGIYQMITGADGSWSKDSIDGHKIVCDADLTKFVEVKVNGILIDTSDYTVTSGSTIITFSPEYLKTLSEGVHNFEIVFTDGKVLTTLTIQAGSNNGFPGWAITLIVIGSILIVGAGGFAAYWFLIRKGKVV